MKTLPKILFALTAVAALLVVYPASVQAVPTTYQYTGNPFTVVTAPYTTSDFVTGMLTFAAPLPANMPLTNVKPISFRFSDGVQTITQSTTLLVMNLQVATGPAGQITDWLLYVQTPFSNIETAYGTLPHGLSFDQGVVGNNNYGFNVGAPGTWTRRVADTGSTLSLMTLTFMALGVAARQFKGQRPDRARASRSLLLAFRH